MKWSMVGFLLAAVVAALCTALLVGTLRQKSAASPATAQPEVSVVVAARDLPAMQKVQTDSLTTRRMTRDQAPPDCLEDPALAVGKVPSAPLMAGQPVLRASFVPETPAVRMAWTIPAGKRAMTLALQEHSGMEGLLYPGSLVDVLGSFDPPAAAGGSRQPVSVVLLQAVPVLGVAEKTITGPTASAAGEGLPQQKGPSHRTMVTLLVEPAQAEALQLGLEHGALSLAMRNPADQMQLPEQATRIGQLCRDYMPPPPQTAMMADLLKFLDKIGSKTPAPIAPTPVTAVQPVEKTDGQPAEKPKPPQWQVTVLRGGAAETCSFPMPVAQSDEGGK